MEKDDKVQDIGIVSIDESFAPYYTDTFKPWETKEQLELGREVRNNSPTYPPTITCWVYTTTATTFAQNTLLSIPFNQERYDTASMHDNTTNNSRITVPSAWYYLITGTVTFWVNWAGTTASVQLLRNWSTTYDFNRINANPNSGEFCFKICTQVECAANDYLELYIYNDFGGNVTLSTSVWQNTFAALKLAS